MSALHKRRTAQVPYPPVFHDWRSDIDARVAATSVGVAGIRVEMMCPGDPEGMWRTVELTEDDACLLAASLLQRADQPQLAEYVLKKAIA